ncbi:MAG: DUF971 domain-containing protein [Chloroflexi bacterium]|nr:DUF971 domain-containing protein [Chloroflexota bacterium]
MTASHTVSKIKIGDDGLDLEWSDGHLSHYDSKYLRINCACAECVEEWTNRKLLDPLTVAADIHIEDHIPVGKYAVQFLWSDTHYTGIYPFEMLRKLCPCDECKANAES